MNRGQIQLSVATVMAGVSFVAAPIVAYYSSQSAVAEQIAQVKQDAAVVQFQVNDMRTDFDRVERKVDALLIQSGVNPDRIK